jgi:hypothetical protein
MSLFAELKRRKGFRVVVVYAATAFVIQAADNMHFSPGGDQEWFSDGLAEEILNALARLPDLRVASRTGSFQFPSRGRPRRRAGHAEHRLVRKQQRERWQMRDGADQ